MEINARRGVSRDTAELASYFQSRICYPVTVPLADERVCVRYRDKRIAFETGKLILAHPFAAARAVCCLLH